MAGLFLKVLKADTVRPDRNGVRKNYMPVTVEKGQEEIPPILSTVW